MNATQRSSSSAFPLRAAVQPSPRSAPSSPIKPVLPCRYMDPIYTQHIQTRDFYLDTFFNPIWMSGPHVFSFNADGTVKFPKGTSYMAPPRVSGKARAPYAHNTYAAAARSAFLQGLSRSREEMSPLPSATNTKVPVKDDGLVYTWPPNVGSRQRDTGERGSGDDLVYTWPPNVGSRQRDTGERGSGDGAECADDVVTAICASPAVSASTGCSSPMVSTPTQSDNGACALHRSPQASEEGTLKKITGLSRIRRKAPPPLCLDRVDGEIGKIRGILLDCEDEHTAHETQMLSPLTAAFGITCELSARGSIVLFT